MAKNNEAGKQAKPSPRKPAKISGKSGSELNEQDLDKISGGPTAVDKPSFQ
jgi:hypothetical protein